LALEQAEVAFTEIVILLLLLLLFFLFALDHEVAVGKPNLNVLLVHARKLGRDLIGVILFSDVDGGSGGPCQLTSPERLHVKNRAVEGGMPCAATEILEQLVDFAAEALKRPPGLQSSCTLRSLCLFAGTLLAVSAISKSLEMIAAAKYRRIDKNQRRAGDFWYSRR
jgi:hypothetical protein